MEDRKDSQISVVLVHVAFADGLCWSKVIPLLRAKDLNAVAVQNPLNSLADDVAATKSVLDSQDGAVILAGHLLNTSANTARLAKTSRHGSTPLNSMTTPALEEKRKARAHENNEEKKGTKHMSNNNGQKLAGKVAVVTGGSRGIGAAINKRLAADGASVAFTYAKGADAAASVVKEIERSGCSTKAGRPSSTSFYGGNAHGYTDYPFHEESKSQQAA